MRPVEYKGKVEEAKSLKNLKLIHEMEQYAKQITNDRLNDLIKETEVAIAIVQDEGALTTNELNKLQGLQ